MRPEMTLLLEIQELDKEHFQLAEQLRKYPLQWQVLRDKRDQCQKAKEEAERADGDFQTARRKLDDEIKVGKDLIKRYEGQVTLMHKERDFAALTSQIEHTRQRVFKFEEERERLLKREQAIQEQKQLTVQAFEVAHKEAESERERIRKQIRVKKQRLEDIEKTRKELITQIDSQILVRYQRLLTRWPGSVIASVRNGSCTGCHFAVLPQKMVEVHRELEIVACDNCGRLISHDEDYKLETAPVESNQ